MKSIVTLISFLLFISFSGIAQNKIAGEVTDAAGQALPGVTVVASGTTIGTVTGSDGKFTLSVPENTQTLQISFIGMKTQVINIEGKTSVLVKMEQESIGLDEVVAIGYGTMKKSDLTGSVASIKTDEIQKAKTVNFLESMQGKMAGVQVTTQSGEPGSNIEVKIRGASSIVGGISPLYVIDGIQVDVNTNEVASASVATASSMSPLANINPADIESIEVLKDASATAIFGSRGANGVIIVRTKSGRSGKTIFNYDGSFSLSQATKKLDMINGDQYIEYQRILNPTSDVYWDKNGNPKEFPDAKRFDWQDEMLRTATAQTHNFGISGGFKSTTFSASLGYLDQEGIIKKNDYKRYNGRVKVDYAEKRISSSFNLNASYSIQEGASSAGGGTDYNGVVQFITLTKPIDVNDPNADFLTGGKFIYPTSMIDEAEKEIDMVRILGNTYFAYEIIKGLKLQAEIGGNFSSSKSREFYGKETSWGFVDNGKAALQENRSLSWFNREILTYNNKFEKHNVNLMGGFELNAYVFENFFIGVSNFPFEATGYNDISKGKIVSRYTSTKWGTNRISSFGRINYNYDDRYLLTATLRADGSDKFGTGNRFGWFPSVALAWRINQESFLKNAKQLSNLKLRASYGITGNERIPAYSYFARLDNAYYSNNGILSLGLAPAAMANPDLKWESTTQYNGGIDIGLFKERIIFNADYYLKQTTDMLLLAPVSSQSGYIQQWKNIGRVDNNGLELMLTIYNIDKKNFKWSTSVNLSLPSNKIVDLGPGVDFIPVTIYGGFFQNVGRVIKDQPVGTAYGFVWDGVYQIEDFTWQNNSDPAIAHDKRTYTLKPEVVRVAGSTVQPGTFKFKDLNDDGVVDDNNDRDVISQSYPKHFGGINNNLSYKAFELSFFVDWSYGNQILNESKYLSEGTQGWMNLRKDFWDDRWTPDNPTNEHGTFAAKNNTSQFISSYYVEDASFIRLKNVNLTYTLPSKYVGKIGFSDIKIYVNGSNLYTMSKYSGFDPDISFNNQLLPGFDRYSYPKSRTFSLGLKATF